LDSFQFYGSGLQAGKDRFGHMLREIRGQLRAHLPDHFWCASYKVIKDTSNWPSVLSQDAVKLAHGVSVGGDIGYLVPRPED
jgi:hypothetical protein